jgi:hypothetical protein
LATTHPGIKQETTNAIIIIIFHFFCALAPYNNKPGDAPRIITIMQCAVSHYPLAIVVRRAPGASFAARRAKVFPFGKREKCHRELYILMQIALKDNDAAAFKTATSRVERALFSGWRIIALGAAVSSKP